jgi:hypothetical protein
MIWNDLARTVIGLGAPLIGSALAGPLGGAAGKLLADALGASAPTAAAVHDALVGGADSVQVAEAVQKAEAEWAEAIATIARTQLAETGATMRAEAVSGDVLQRWWRPLYALELSLVECPAFALTLLHAPLGAVDRLFRRALRRARRLRQRPHPREAGRRDRGGGAGADRGGGEGGAGAAVLNRL